MGTWTRSDGKALDVASANTTVWNYCDADGNVLFSLKGIVNPTTTTIEIDDTNHIVTLKSTNYHSSVNTTTGVVYTPGTTPYNFIFDSSVTKKFNSQSVATGVVLDTSDTTYKTYLINDAAQLAALATYVNGGKNCSGLTFKLTDNITLTGNWTPIGKSSTVYFKGTFDGGIYDAEGKLTGNHTISDLNIDSTLANQGLFGYTDGATIKNLTLKNPEVKSTSATGCVGALVGNAAGADEITNCNVTGTVTISSSTNKVGGLVGYINGKAEITNCTVTGTGTVTGTTGVGGIVGNENAAATVTNCTVSGVTVTGTGNVGGIIGLNKGTVENCTTKSDVSVKRSSGTNTTFGGIVGSNSGGSFNDCVWEIGTAEQLKIFADFVNAASANTCAGVTVKLTANINLADLKDANGNSIAWTPIGTYSTTTANVRKFCGTFDGGGHTISGLSITTAANYKGLFGYTNNATIKDVTLSNVTINVLANTAITGVGALVGYASGTGGSIENCTVNANEIKISTTSSGVGSIVGKNEGSISGCTVNVDDANFSITDSMGFTIDKTGAYLINNVDDLVKFAEYVNKNKDNTCAGMTFKLADNITLTGDWTPIGTYSNTSTNVRKFCGTFDGNGKTISGLNIDSTLAYQGLFGYTDGATIKNLTLSNVSLKCTNTNTTTNTYVGAVVGNAAATKIINCNLSGSVNISNTKSKGNLGGLVGSANADSEIRGCTINGTVNVTSSGSGGSVGGIVGTTAGAVTKCTVNDSITVNGTTTVGGLVGTTSGTVSECNITGDVTVTGTTKVGGLVGSNATKSISDCHINQNNTTNIVSVTGATTVGGLIGSNGSGAVTSCNVSGSKIAIEGKGTTSVNGSDVGGLIGSNTSGAVTSCNVTSDELSVEGTGTTGNDGGNIGGLIGSNGGTITSCGLTTTSKFYASGDTNVGGFIGSNTSTITGSTMTTTGSTVTINGTGKISEVSQTVHALVGGADTTDYSGSITYTGPAQEITTSGFSLDPNDSTVCLIKDADGLLGLANYVNNGNDYAGLTFKLTADIDLSTLVEVNGEQKDWMPIGNDANPFTGIFDGNGKTISNLKIAAGGDYQGLFGNISGATISGLTLNNVEVNGTTYIGAFIGNATNREITETTTTTTTNPETGEETTTTKTTVVGTAPCTITNCNITGTVKVNSTGTLNSTTTAGTVGKVIGVNATETTISGCNFNEDNITVTFHGLTLDTTYENCKTYLINNLQQFQAFADYVNAGNTGSDVTFKLANDIDLSTIENWTPIGNEAKKFAGIFDGNSKTISNLTITGDGDYKGLFGYTNNAKIQNVTLSGVNISGGSNVGALVGCANSTSDNIKNCTLTGNNSISGTSNVGGLVGYNKATLTSCTVNCAEGSTISGTSDVGGMIGYNTAGLNSATNSSEANANTVTGSVTVTGTTNIGGFIGNNTATTIKFATVSGSVSVTGTGDNVGGLIGNHSYSSTTTTTVAVTDCTVSDNVSVSGGNNVGGLLGYNTKATLTSCTVNGTVNGGSNVGGVVGENKGTITSCTVNGTVNGGSNVGGIVGSNTNASAAIESCTVTECTVTGTSDVGGIVGENIGKITSCTVNEGKVIGTGDNIGGIIGNDSGTSNTVRTIGSNKFSGSVSGNNNVGGIVGNMQSGKIGLKSNVVDAKLTGNPTTTGAIIGTTNTINTSYSDKLNSYVIREGSSETNTTNHTNKTYWGGVYMLTLPDGVTATNAGTTTTIKGYFKNQIGNTVYYLPGAKITLSVKEGSTTLGAIRGISVPQDCESFITDPQITTTTLTITTVAGTDDNPLPVTINLSEALNIFYKIKLTNMEVISAENSCTVSSTKYYKGNVTIAPKKGFVVNGDVTAGDTTLEEQNGTYTVNVNSYTIVTDKFTLDTDHEYVFKNTNNNTYIHATTANASGKNLTQAHKLILPENVIATGGNGFYCMDGTDAYTNTAAGKSVILGGNGTAIKTLTTETPTTDNGDGTFTITLTGKDTMAVIGTADVYYTVDFSCARVNSDGFTVTAEDSYKPTNSDTTYYKGNVNISFTPKTGFVVDSTLPEGVTPNADGTYSVNVAGVTAIEMPTVFDMAEDHHYAYQDTITQTDPDTQEETTTTVYRLANETTANDHIDDLFAVGTVSVPDGMTVDGTTVEIYNDTKTYYKDTVIISGVGTGAAIKTDSGNFAADKSGKVAFNIASDIAITDNDIFYKVTIPDGATVGDVTDDDKIMIGTADYYKKGTTLTLAAKTGYTVDNTNVTVDGAKDITVTLDATEGKHYAFSTDGTTYQLATAENVTQNYPDLTQVYQITLPEGVTTSDTDILVTDGNKIYAPANAQITLSTDKDLQGDNLTNNNDGIYTYTVGTTDAALTITTDATYYIDANGTRVDLTEYTVITDSTTNITAAGNYVVKGNVTITGQLTISGTGDVNLILTDGAKLTVNGGESNAVDFGTTLNIFGQTAGTGELIATSNSNRGIHSANAHLNINGGKVTATGNGIDGHGIELDGGSLTINGGTVTAKTNGTSTEKGIYVGGNVTINGGQVTATGASYGSGISVTSNNKIKLGWKNATDFIDASSYEGTVTFSKRFYDASGNVNSTSGGKLTPLDGYIVTVPTGVTVSGATRIGETNNYIVAADGAITVANFASGQITFDEAITKLEKGDNNITATTRDGKSFTVSGFGFASDTTTWTLDNTTATYQRTATAGATIDNTTITYNSTATDVSFAIIGLKDNLGDKITVIDNNIYVYTGETAPTADNLNGATLIGTFTDKAIALNANALPTGFTDNTTTKFADGVPEGYTLDIITTGDAAVFYIPFTPAVDDNAGTFAAIEGGYKFSSPAYKEYFTATGNTITGRPAITSRDITLTTDATLALDGQTVAFQSDSDNKISVVTLTDGTTITFSATTDEQSNITDYTVTLDANFLNKVAQGGKVTLSGGTFADITATDTIATSAETFKKSATFDTTSNTYTAAITAGDYFSKNANEIEHVAQVGGESFTINGLYVPEGYTLDVDATGNIIAKKDTDTITLATINDHSVELQSGAFNAQSTTDQTVTLIDTANNFTLTLASTLAAPADIGDNTKLEYSNGGYQFTASGKSAGYEHSAGTLTATFKPQVNGQQFTITGLDNATLGNTLTIDSSGNVTGNGVAVGTFANDKFTLTNVAALGTVGDNGATISLQKVAPIGSAEAINYQLEVGGDFNSVDSVPAKAGDNYNKGDAATDGTYTYTYTAEYTPAYTLNNDNGSYTYHKEEAHDVVKISGLKGVDDFNTLITRSGNQFTLSENILPNSDGTISLTVNGTGSYTLGLGTDVATKSYQVADTNNGGSITAGAYTPPSFRAYYEIADGAQSITTHKSIAPTSAAFTISGLDNYTATYTNNESGGGTATIADLGTIEINADGNYTIKLKASALQGLLTSTETSKDFTLSKTTDKEVSFTVTGDDLSTEITTATEPTVTTGKGWYDYAADTDGGYKAVYKSDAYDDYWKTAENGYTYTKAVAQENLVTISGLKSDLSTEQLASITTTKTDTGYSVTISQELLNTVEGATISVDTGNKLIITTDENTTVGETAEQVAAALTGTGNTYTYTAAYNKAYFAGTNGDSSYTYHAAQTPDTFSISGTALVNAAIPTDYNIADYLTVDADKKVTLGNAILKTAPAEGDTITISGTGYTLNNPLEITTIQAKGFHATDGTLDYKITSTAAGYEAYGTGYKYKTTITSETPFSISGLPTALKDYTFSVNASNEIIATKDESTFTLGTFDEAPNAVTLKQELWNSFDATPDAVALTGTGYTLTITKGTLTVADDSSANAVDALTYGWTATTPSDGVATYEQHTRDEIWTRTAVNSYKFNAEVPAETLFTLSGLADTATLTSDMVDGKTVNVTNILPTATNTTLTISNSEYTLTVDSTVERVFTSDTAEGVTVAAKFEGDTFTSSHTDPYYLKSDASISYKGGKAATSFKLSGVEIPETATVSDTTIGNYVKIDGDTVTINSVGELKTYTGEKISLTSNNNYKLALDSSLLLTNDKQHAAAFTQGEITGTLASFDYKGAFTDAHFDAVDNNVANFVKSTESDAATFTVNNLNKDTNVATLLDALNNKTLTLTTELLPNDLGANKITISDGYTLQLATGIQPAPFSDQFTGSNGEYEFTAGGKLEGFYNEGGGIVYHAADSENYFTTDTKKKFKLTGLKSDLGTLSLVNGSIISSTGKTVGTLDGTTVTLNSDALTTSDVELQTTSDYTLALDSKVTAPAAATAENTSDPKLLAGWSEVVDGKATYHGFGSIAGWTLGNNKINYTAAVNGADKFELGGLAKNDLSTINIGTDSVTLTTDFVKTDGTALTLTNATGNNYKIVLTGADRQFSSETADGVTVAATFEGDTFTSSYTDPYYLKSDTSISYKAGTAPTSFKLSGVTIPETETVSDTAIGNYVTISGDTVTINSVGELKTYSGEKISLTSDDNYKLALDDSLLLTSDKQHAAKFTKGTESGTLASFDYKGAYDDAHFNAVSDNVANFVPSTESQAATFTVSNLSATTDVATLLDALNGTTLTLTTELLPNDLGANKITISNGYTLDLETGIEPAPFSDEFTGGNGEYEFTAGGKLEGFYNENGEIVYHAADNATYFTTDTKKKFTISGLATNLGTLSLVDGSIISSTGKTVGTLDGTTIKLNSNALTTGNVELQTTSDYTLALDESVVAPIVSGVDGWSVVNGTAKFSSATTNEGWSVDNNKIKYTAASVGDGELFTLSGLRKGINTLTQDGDNIISGGAVIGKFNKDAGIITLTEEALPTATDDTYVEIIGTGYQLELGSLPVASALVEEELTLSGTTATYTSPSREAGYVLSGDKKLLTYAATNSTTFTITGLKSGLGTLTLNDDNEIKAGDTFIGTFNKSTGVVTLNKNALSTETTKLTGDGYSLELAAGLTEATIINGKFAAVDAESGTATYTTTAISDYYKNTATNEFTYVAAVDDANLIINGLKGDALDINYVADHITVTNEDKVISVTINDRDLLGEETVTFTKPDDYTLKLNVNHSITTGAVDGNGQWYYSNSNICAYTVGDIQEYYKIVGETLEYVPATHKDSNQRLVLCGVNSTELTSDDIEFNEAAGTVTFKKNLGDLIQVLKNSAGYKYVFAEGVEPFKFIGASTNDTINVTGNDMTIYGGAGNDVISFAEGTTGGVVELSAGNDTIAYGTNYKIKFNGVYNRTVIGNDVVFSDGSASLTVTDALGKTVNVIGSSGSESTLKIFKNFDSMLTYSDYRKYGVTLNGSAEVEADSSKALFTEPALKSTGYSSNAISIKASNTMSQAVSIEGNAVSNFVIGNNLSGNTLNGGKGNDSVIGGTGADVFYYKSGDGNDTISNYQSQDTIMLADLTDENITGDKVYVSGNDLVYTLGKNRLILKNVFSSSNQAAVNLITDDGNALNYTYDKSKGTMTDGKTIGLLASATTYAVTPGETITDYRPEVKLTGIAVEDISKTNVRVATNTITLGLKSGDSVVISGTGSNDQLNLNGTLYTVGKNYLSTNDTKYILTSGNVDGLDLTNATSDSTINATLTSSGVEIVGGSGNDELIGGTGNDKFIGNAGSDVFIYSGGKDTITDYSFEQGDVISLNAALNFADINFDGDDLTINGADGNSLAIIGGSGKKLTIDDGTGKKNYTFQNDGVLNADGTAITLKADHGNYTASDDISSIDASSAIDGAVITARNANSFITAGDKGLTLVGGTGKDTLLEGTGNSNLTGNTGDDLFIIGSGDDTITDYGTGSDSVTLTDYTMNDLTGVTKSGSNVALTFGSNKLKIDNPAVDVITIDGKGYKFDNGNAITDDNKSVILVTNSTVDLSTAYTDAQTILANGGGKITAGAIGKTIGGKNVTLVGGDGKDTFIYNGGDMDIQNYDADNDVISLSAGYSINDSQVSGSTVTLTITDGTNNGTMTIDAGNSDSLVIKTDKGDEPLYIEQIDFAFDDDDPEIATAVTVVADKGDFGVQGDENDSRATKDEYYQGIESITATKENSTLTGNANSNTFYVKGGGANVLTGGIGKDYFVFNSGGGVITDYGSGTTKLGNKTALAGSTTDAIYNRNKPGTYKEGLDVLQVNGTVKEIAYTGRGNSKSKYNATFTAYVTYEDNNGDDYVIKLENIYKTATKYGTSPNYRTDDYVAARFQIWDTSNDGSTMQQLTLTDDLFNSDVTAAETLLTDLMATKPLTTTGNLLGSSNPLASNSSNNNSAPVVVNTNGDKNNG